MTKHNENLHTEEMTLNFGPQHPSTHGVYRAIFTLDGEQIVKIENVIGYLHRGIEKLAESRTYTQFIPYTDRLDYLSGMLNELGYVQTVEILMGIEIPERAEYLRIIMAELQRMASHQVFLGSMALDLNSHTSWMYFFRDREKILDLFEMVCGSRMTTNYMRIGGVSYDLPTEFIPRLNSFLDDMERSFLEYDRIITGNEIFKARTKGVGVISKEKALAYGLTGPNLRASGVDLDLRRDIPYGFYERFKFKAVVGSNGDCYERWLVRIGEMEESVKIIKQALEQIQEGPILAKVPKLIKLPVGDIYHQIEGAKGALGFYLVSNGTDKPHRVHIHGPSFINIGAFPEVAKGGTIQDAVAILASLDPILGEIDR
ncbi:NADH-quinone oxidoreductase subunit D [Clostridium zeae]|uniref:NADH-quinone oxidoreductase subunit D n=1 Tax=Clostridium zeae TaxID=2759022 RepID=A0ABQ1EG78_9CLOT|nr:NADH-quinone oxidoreductase subunit D [Clostridium zeae]GFZ33832.1 NADH-quinone oxidoreductase subunit D [Clostridium zeae]